MSRRLVSVLVAMFLLVTGGIVVPLSGCGDTATTTTVSVASTTSTATVTTVPETTTTTEPTTTTLAKPKDGDRATATLGEVRMHIVDGGAAGYAGSITFEDGSTADAELDLPDGTMLSTPMVVIAEMRGGAWVVVEVR